jgi:hypothetical protein
MIGKLIRAFRPTDMDGSTVPSMDGALKPNQRLELALSLFQTAEPDMIVPRHEDFVVTAGSSLYSVKPAGQPIGVRTFEQKITAAAALPDGGLVIGLMDGTIRFLSDGGEENARVERLAGTAGGPTALAIAANGDIAATFGSAVHGNDAWRRDLMTNGATGSLWRIAGSTDKKKLCDGLRWPAGVVDDPKLGLVIAEAWSHRLRAVAATGSLSVILAQLPGYPGRIARVDGGHVLCLFAPRLAMVEFILKERGFRERMVREIPEAYWMAPAYCSGLEFKEPLLGGAVKQLGVMKPWAPTRSYGLVVRLDEEFNAIASFHSRGDGTRHGVTSAAEFQGNLIFASRGGNLVGSLGNKAHEECRA